MTFGIERRGESDAFPNWPKHGTGFDVLEFKNGVLTIEGWYDHIASWSGQVTLTEKQRRKLAAALLKGLAAYASADAPGRVNEGA